MKVSGGDMADTKKKRKTREGSKNPEANIKGKIKSKGKASISRRNRRTQKVIRKTTSPTPREDGFLTLKKKILDLLKSKGSSEGDVRSLSPEENGGVAPEQEKVREEGSSLRGVLKFFLALNPEDILETPVATKDIIRLLSILTPRQAKIIKMRFGIGGEKEHTWKEIAKFFNLSVKKIRKIEEEAIRKLRSPVKAKLLKEFLEERYS
jgi:RNA polymerase sigma factor (sigma-70 family)